MSDLEMNGAGRRPEDIGENLPMIGKGNTFQATTGSSNIDQPGILSLKRNVERLVFFLLGFLLARWTMGTGTSATLPNDNNGVHDNPSILTESADQFRVPQQESGDDTNDGFEPALDSTTESATVPESVEPKSFSIESVVGISAADAKAALAHFGQEIAHVPRSNILNTRRCTLTSVGSGWGKHKLCENLIQYNPTGNCLVYSFGISTDYSFDLAAQNKTGCEVIGMDPTVHHPAMLGPHVRFYEWGAPGLFESKTWKIVPVSQVAREVNLEDMPVKILKMDCEGCEYKLYEDIAKNDPDFFNRIDQFAVEVHVSKYWMSTEEHALNYGRLLAMLQRSGLRLMHAQMTGCAAELEKYGCHPILKESGYLCSEGRMCQNFLFARA